MKVALIGPLLSGKSMLFAAVSGKRAAASGSASIEEAIVPVPDERFDYMEGLYQPKKVTAATIDALDVPGLSFTDEHGRAAARRLLNKIRTVDMLVLVVRAFEDTAVAPYKNTVDASRDLAEMKTELLLADYELISARIEKLEKQIKKPAKSHNDAAELKLQRKLAECIESEKPLSTAVKTDEEYSMVKSLGFLTLKPIMVAVNIGENQINQSFVFGEGFDRSVPLVCISAKLENELAQLDEQSRREFMADLGLKSSAIGKFVNGCYKALGLISFLTTGSDELRAWPIKQGTTAVEAAGKVHSDIQRGFIRARTFSFEELKQYGSEKALKAAGKIRLEGKKYVVQDGDIIDFRFNV